MSSDRTYHHGDLRRAVLTAALDVIRTEGPGALSLRDLARRAGVSHAAPAHHFKDRTGLLTAIAAEGYALFADALADAPDLRERGVRYVRFATGHPAHFQVMFQPELHRPDDPELLAAKARAAQALRAGVTGLPVEGRGDDPRLMRHRRLVPGSRLRHPAPERQSERPAGRPERRGGVPVAHRAVVQDPRIVVRNSPVQASSSRPTTGLPPTLPVVGRGTRIWWRAGLITVFG